MVPIETFVFLDIETTGITKHEMDKIKITELCLIAVEKTHLLETQCGLMPRVQNKITMSFTPWKLILPNCSKETGLTNYLLENETGFDKTVFTVINSFLSLLRKPVCVIAHNGLKFDFPILKSHLNALKVEFHEDLLCSDSLCAFYNILEKKHTKETDIVEIIDLCDDKNADIQEINASPPKKPALATNYVPMKLKPNLSSPSKEFWYHNKPVDSYKLSKIYKRLLDRPARTAHRAENDCLMLLECAVAKSEKFVWWIENNHQKFSDVQPMTSTYKPTYW